jgi:hypothetical protein
MDNLTRKKLRYQWAGKSNQDLLELKSNYDHAFRDEHGFWRDRLAAKIRSEQIVSEIAYRSLIKRS